MIWCSILCFAHHHSSPSSLAIIGWTFKAQQRLVVFLPKSFLFGQAQHFMRANAVFLCQRFLVVKAKLCSFPPLWGGFKVNHKPAESSAYSIVKAKASFGPNQFFCAKDFWLWTPNFSVSHHCEGVWNQPTNLNCEGKRKAAPDVQVRALKFLSKSCALTLHPRDEERGKGGEENEWLEEMTGKEAEGDKFGSAVMRH